MMTLMKSTWSNFLDLLPRESHLIWYVAYACPYMALSNHSVCDLVIFKLSSNNLGWCEVMLIILCSIVILPMDISISLDDIIITHSDKEGIVQLKQYLAHLVYFIDIEVAQSEDGLFISQRKFSFDILEETRMTNAKLLDTLMIQMSNLYLTKENLILIFGFIEG